MGLINVMVSQELMTQALYLDTSDFGKVDIVNANVNDRGDVILTLENSNFPDRIEGEAIKMVRPEFCRSSVKLTDWRFDG
jgi:hypothetical protein